MWFGKDTEKLLKAKKEYEEKFGYNPDSEIEVEYQAWMYRVYLHDIKKCIKKGVDIANLYN